MPTIDKKIAEREIKKVKDQKRPKVYCIANYQDRLRGDSENFTYSDYFIAYKKEHYDTLMNSPNVGGVNLLWESKRFKEDMFEMELDDDGDWRVDFKEGLMDLINSEED